MKNKRIEQYKLQAKEYRKTALNRTTYDPDRKIVIFHSYLDDSGNLYKTHGAWDDVSFVHGSYYISVCWTHPRYEYYEKCDSTAYKEATDLFDSENASLWLDCDAKNYKKVGKSRKKVVSYSSSFSRSSEDFYSHWKSKRIELLETSNVVIKPFFNVHQTSWSKQIFISFPIEVIDEPSLGLLADKVREYLDTPNKFVDEFGNYVYDSRSYKEEAEALKWDK